MKYNEFTEWLQNEKSMSVRSARDVVSRLKRCLKLTGANEVNTKTANELNKSAEFDELTTFVKSQLKRSVTLYIEFLEK